MRRVRLGRTGLEASIAGLGCGGPSRLGQGRGANRAEAVALVRSALDLGVTLIDTSPAYGNEDIVGEALSGCREGVIIATKAALTMPGKNEPVTPVQLAIALEESLSKLRVDTVDLFLLHGVSSARYPYCHSVLLPELQRLRRDGKVRFYGLSEGFEGDPEHHMLRKALQDDCWDCIMVAVSMAYPSALQTVLPPAKSRDVGTLIMRAARDVLIRRDFDGARAALMFDSDCSAERIKQTLADACYRYCAHLDGAHVVLTGPGSIQHLQANARSIAGSRLEPHIEAALLAWLEN